MSAPEVLSLAAIVLFVLAFVFIALAVIVFFTRNIPDVYADLTGRKRAEAVAEIDSNRSRERRRVSRRDASQDTSPANKAAAGKTANSPVQSPIRVVEPQYGSQEPVESRRHIVPQPQPLDDEVATTILPDDTEATIVFDQGQVVEDSTVFALSEKVASAVPLEGFRVVRKIVLMESRETIRPSKGVTA